MQRRGFLRLAGASVAGAVVGVPLSAGPAVDAWLRRTGVLDGRARSGE